MQNLLLHKEPFLFIDSIIIKNGQIHGKYTFRQDYFAFKGHFPNHPIVPGVLLIECMVQCGGAGANLLQKKEASLFVLSSVEKARFHKIVKPEDEINIVVENLVIHEKYLNQKGNAFVNNKLAASAEWLCINTEI